MSDEKNYGKMITGVKILVVLLIILSACLALVNMTMIQDVEVVCGNHFTEDEIKDYVIKDTFDKNAIYLYLKNKYTDTESIPFVEYVDVELKSRNSVKITVYEKKVVGCLDYMNKYIYFDKEGYFIEQSEKKLEDVPYVTGIEFKSMKLYDKMSVDEDELFKTVMNMTQLINKYELSIDEINFDSERNISLYSGDIEVLLGKKDSYDEQIAKLESLFEKSKGMKGTFHMENYSDSTTNIIFDKK